MMQDTSFQGELQENSEKKLTFSEFAAAARQTENPAHTPAAKTSFPVASFPKKMQHIIMETNRCLNYPIDFTGTSMLSASSVAIGNTHRVVVKKGFDLPVVLYCALVGGKGTMKSHPLSFAIKPLTKRDERSYDEYLLERNEYDIWLETPKKERETNVAKPFMKKHLVQDFTPESLQAVHHDNQRGLIAYNDELIAWTNNFGRYSGGSEEQFWLSNWTGTFTDISRQNKAVRIKHSFISVIGTLQPKLLRNFSEGRLDNGFLDRILFAYPLGLKKEVWNDNELDDSIFEDYNDIINGLLELEHRKEPVYVPFSIEAKTRLYEWQAQNTAIANQSSDYEAGICSKLETYVPRFALILQLLHHTCKEVEQKNIINLQIVEKAIDLIEYFRETATRVYSEVLNANIMDSLEGTEKSMYESLPVTFTTKDAVMLVKELGIDERTVYRYLNNRKIYGKQSKGAYIKIAN
jgi:predicted transcriptional regulator YheO